MGFGPPCNRLCEFSGYGFCGKFVGKWRSSHWRWPHAHERPAVGNRWPIYFQVDTRAGGGFEGLGGYVVVVNCLTGILHRSAFAERLPADRWTLACSVRTLRVRTGRATRKKR